MAQIWDPQAYGQNGAFVHGLAGGVLEWLEAQTGERILDLGCGDGQLTARVALSGANVVGLDASPQMAAAARSRGMRAVRSRCLTWMEASTRCSRMRRCTGCAIRMQCWPRCGACSRSAAGLWQIGRASGRVRV